MKIAFLLGLIVTSCVGLAGCESTNRIGTVNGETFTVLRSRAFLEGPNIAVVVSDRGNPEGPVAVVGTFASDGALNSVVQASGSVAAASEYEGDRNDTTTNTTVNVRGPVPPVIGPANPS